MKRYIIKISGLLAVSTLLLTSCGPKENPPLVYFPDMYFPVAYDPLMKAEDAYSDKENNLPPFVNSNGATWLTPVDGTVNQNEDGVVEENNSKALTSEQYNAGYDASKLVVESPLDPANADKDIERGKHLYERTCAACHGVNGDGKGPIVESGAYLGVPNFKDREVSVGSVHYVLSHGRNAMGSYAGQLKPGDRWRVAMYVMNKFKNQSAAAVAEESTQTK